MTRNTHDRLNDHFGTDLDTNVLVNGDIGVGPVIADGDSLHTALTALEALVGGGGGGLAVSFQSFTTPGSATWTDPGSVAIGLVICVGSGGGGGGGAKGAAGQLNLGGSGGAGGGWTSKWIKGSDLVGNKLVYVPTGGSAGSGATSDDTRGSNGNGGEAAGFGQSSAFDLSDALVVAGGGDGGVRGALNVGTNSQIGALPGFGNIASRLFLNQDTGVWSTLQAHELVASGGRSDDATLSNSVNGADKFACGGGGAGGVTTTGNLNRNGGRGGIPQERRGGDRFASINSTSGWNYSAGGTAPGGNGGTVPAPTDVIRAGFGGGGGASRISGASAAGIGADGGLYGGGGGGGGAGRNAVVNGGAGGAGAKGAVFVVAWYAS